MSDETKTARNPRAEAGLIAGPGLAGVVLEPSPPAVTTGPWFADDPVDSTGLADPVLVPSGIPGSSTWAEWLAEHPEHEEWVAHRWLGGRRRLPPVPVDLEPTRRSLHRLAAYVIAPARHRSTGKFGLRWTLDGFGTPFFGDDRQVRVEGTTLVDQRGDEISVAPITTLAAAADFLDVDVDPDTAAEHDSPPAGDPHEPLTVDPEAARFLGQWFAMAFAALEMLRADPHTVDPSRPQLWPGHFDPAIEAGDEGHRASFGASPGDATIAEPYLYVSVWWPDRVGVDAAAAEWNAPGFTGRVLRASEFGDADPVERAHRFWATTRDLLAG